ncbi:hypothetical protein EYF80_062655 [Liparis tanakae]|uniref:Uncharacterized protein n=1 Tax=Liparis tanakae TaxID=230148 RepID=A0A4Z2EFV8_9TELE|nr:hypothetical protein EYF80_062655 [Liparis tanakae]
MRGLGPCSCCLRALYLRRLRSRAQLYCRLPRLEDIRPSTFSTHADNGLTELGLICRRYTENSPYTLEPTAETAILYVHTNR